MIAKNELYLLESHVESSEELTGKVRAAVGKAKLLLCQKFEQFAGLCRKNLVCTGFYVYPLLCFLKKFDIFNRLKAPMSHFRQQAKIWQDFGIW